MVSAELGLPASLGCVLSSVRFASVASGFHPLDCNPAPRESPFSGMLWKSWYSVSLVLLESCAYPKPITVQGNAVLWLVRLK